MTALSAPPPRSAGRVGRTQLMEFRELCEEASGEDLSGAPALHRWSVTRSEQFWRTFLDWSQLLWEGSAEPVLTGADVRRDRFFPGVRLNYTENLLRRLDEETERAPALTSVHGDGTARTWTRAELRREVERTGAALAALGVERGQRVVVIAPNHAGVAIVALAGASLGATLSTATPDMGVETLVGRFEQVAPACLVVDRRGMDKGAQTADVVLTELLRRLPSVRLVLVLDPGPLPDPDGVPVRRLADRVAAVPADGPAPHWPRLPFDHPLWVMFTSGTTGPPKPLVHGAGGSLIEHVKEHRLHGDLDSRDTLYFHTTTAWMMWNWQLSALAVGAHVVVYDGPVTGPETLWELAARHHVTVFGTSPAYLQVCQDEGYRPRDSLDLTALRAVLCTGAVLHDWQYAWFADAVGDPPLQSISGGTDIVGCFVLGHPEQPVRAGRCSSLSLGLDVAAFDDEGRPVLGVAGELVCRRPFPSRPVGLLADSDGSRFTAAYFAHFPGVWTHGDRIEIGADGSARMFGRSDGVLMVDGVRIGPTEIYAIVRAIPGIADAMAVEQERHAGGSRLVLLVVLRPGVRLDEAFTQRIRSVLRNQGSPAHVPSRILAVPELPRTHSGKPSEQAVRDTLDGRPVRNAAALRNPGSLLEIGAAAAGGDPAADDAVPAAEMPGSSARSATAVAIATAFREVLGRPAPEEVSFFDLGGTSRQSMTLLRRLRVELDRPVEMADLLAAPSVRELASLLADRRPEDPGVRTLRGGNPAVPPLHVVHGAHGDLDSYVALVERLATSAPVVGLLGRLAAPDGQRLPLEDVAAAHAATIDAGQPEGPVRLLGYSFGGLVALESARRLAAAGRDIGFIGLLDVRLPYASLTRWQGFLRRLAGGLALVVPGITEESLATAFRDRLRSGDLPADRAVLRDSARVYEAFRVPPYAGPVTYFRVRRRIPLIAHLLPVWRRLLPALDVVDVRGTHNGMLAEKHAEDLAARVSAALART
ncbi:acetoacetate--CoA ligase [Trujillonella endophytica]|uniref:Acetoacetyl-CoA synthetase n=1 Tax=Trujillonella endophytica TaxID=673521 RepID=A0A1H8W4T1_9ACTN|nr:acetoacetate--CoA ligase [Trujillella endophytica]SEP22553.1 acetoacetyl-CoA synthetase [Trujillella endophytica]